MTTPVRARAALDPYRTSSRPAPRAEAAPRRRGIGTLGIAAVLAAIAVAGAPYYALDPADRARSPLHVWLRPSGWVGQTAGFASLAVMLLLWLYPLRKRWRWLGFTGSLAGWLDVHVAAALVLPLLVAIHAAWRFDGLIGLGVLLMMVVWASGVVGRFLYTRIPRGKAGVVLTRSEIAAQRDRLLGQIAQHVRLDAAAVAATLAQARSAPPVGTWAAIRQMARERRVRRRALRELRRLLAAGGRRGLDARARAEVLRLAEREMRLAQEASLLDASQQLLRLWHVVHRPVAFAALVAVCIHVAVVVLLGATWLW